MKMVVKAVGTLDSINIRQDGTMQLRFKLPLTEISGAAQFLNSIGKTISGLVTTQENEKVKIPGFSMKQLSFDKDGESKLTLIGEVSTVDIGALSSMREESVMLKFKIEDSGESSDE